MSLNEQDLLDLKKKIESAKTKVAELTGRRNHLMEELKKDWDCASEDKAREVLKHMNDKIEELNQKIEDGIHELQDKYDV